MEKFITDNGVFGILTAIVVMLAINIITKVGEFLWKLKEKRDAVTEKGLEKLAASMQITTVSIEKLETQLKTLEASLTQMKRFESDLRRMFAALKLVAGDNWKMIRKEIMEEEKPL